jgi:hypothetical protein
MKNDEDVRGGVGPHPDAKQCELLSGLACNTERSFRPAVPSAPPSPEPTGTRTRRDSLTQAMFGLILDPDAF